MNVVKQQLDVDDDGARDENMLAMDKLEAQNGTNGGAEVGFLGGMEERR